METFDNELKIFIAGAKELSEERSCIKEVANDLSSSTGTHVFAISYEQLDDKQATYNSYIKEKADIVIFVIDKALGARTEDEFSIAANSYKNEKHPEVIVLLRKFNKEEITSEMAIERARIEGLIKGKFDDGKYYIDYSKDDDEKDHNIRLKDLKIQAEKRISRYISQHCNNGNAKIEHSATPSVAIKSSSQNDDSLKKRLTTYRLIVCASIITLVGIFVWHLLSNKSEFAGKTSGFKGRSSEHYIDSLIVFAGGGSVRNYLRQEFGETLDVLKYPQSINIGLASGSSWRVLSEEYQYRNDKGINKFVTVCLSASEISDSSSFYKEHIYDKEDAIVGELFLGFDTMNVIVSNELLGVCSLKDRNMITATELSNLILQIIEAKEGGTFDARIFTTNKTSGTLDAYQRCLAKTKAQINLEYLVDNDYWKLLDSILKTKKDKSELKQKCIQELEKRQKVCCIYYDKSEGTEINTGNDGISNKTKPYIILASKYYYPINLDQSKYTAMVVTDDKGDVQTKPMFLYFLALKEENSKDHYIVNGRIADYLKLLDGKIKVDATMQTRWDNLISSRIIDFQSDGCKGKIVKINKECAK